LAHNEKRDKSILPNSSRYICYKQFDPAMSEQNNSTPADDPDSTSSSSEDEDKPETHIETLVAGRSKRATAGNRLNTLLEKEAADDELELLFAEDGEEEDVEFEGEDGENVSDVQLDSTSDDEDQGPAANTDDLEGERELQKQDKAERRKKRKGQELFKRPPPSKKVKVDPTVGGPSPLKKATGPKKKSERISWLPTPEEGPVRSSSRKQTVQNKEVVHQRMQENEKRRRRQILVMEAAARRKEASKAKAMTQADRMAEALRTEKRNAKSLNRWEEMEKKRLEEQKARLAALHNRKLQGPVISWWSGPSKWVNGKLIAVGSKNIAKSSGDGGQSQEGGSGHTTTKSLSKDTGDTIVVGAASGTNVMDNQTARSAVAPPPLASQIYSAPILPQPGFHDEPWAPIAVKQQWTGTAAAGPPAYHHYIGIPPPYQPPPPPLTEISTRNLISLKGVDVNPSRTPELQNHVLVAKRLPVKLRSKFPCCDWTSWPPDILTNAQKRRTNYAPSPITRPSIVIRQRVYLTATHMRTKRYKSSARAGLGGAVCSGATLDPLPVLPEVSQSSFFGRQEPRGKGPIRILVL
jgi:hypothetical protein